LLTALLDKFNASQHSVKVVPAVIPFSTFAQTVLTQMSAGKGPDLLRMDIPGFEQAAHGKLLAPMDKMFDQSKYDLIKSNDTYNFVNGKRYGVIFEAINYALIYNPSLISTPPKTFSQFVADAKAATKDGVYGYAVRTTQPESAGMWQDLCSYVYGFGGSWGNGTKLTINSPKVIEAIDAFKEIYDAGVEPKGATASTYRTMYSQGKVAMMADHGGIPSVVQGLNPKIPVEAAPIPFPVKHQAVAIAPLVVNQASKHKAADATFIRWLLKPENQTALQEVLGGSSVAVKTTRSASELKAHPYLKVYDDLNGTGYPFTVKGFEAKTEQISNIVVQQVIAALSGQQTVKAAMDKAQQLSLAAANG
jgi:multiple sugar transport system substrate-binding protein